MDITPSQWRLKGHLHASTCLKVLFSCWDSATWNQDFMFKSIWDDEMIMCVCRSITLEKSTLWKKTNRKKKLQLNPVKQLSVTYIMTYNEYPTHSHGGFYVLVNWWLINLYNLIRMRFYNLHTLHWHLGLGVNLHA